MEQSSAPHSHDLPSLFQAKDSEWEMNDIFGYEDQYLIDRMLPTLTAPANPFGSIDDGFDSFPLDTEPDISSEFLDPGQGHDISFHDQDPAGMRPTTLPDLVHEVESLNASPASSLISEDSQNVSSTIYATLVTSQH